MPHFAAAWLFHALYCTHAQLCFNNGHLKVALLHLFTGSVDLSLISLDIAVKMKIVHLTHLPKDRKTKMNAFVLRDGISCSTIRLFSINLRSSWNWTVLPFVSIYSIFVLFNIDKAKNAFVPKHRCMVFINCDSKISCQSNDSQWKTNKFSSDIRITAKCIHSNGIDIIYFILLAILTVILFTIFHYRVNIFIQNKTLWWQDKTYNQYK